jgi:hypothetical protein
VTNTAATTITSFDDGVSGQAVDLLPTNGNTTIAHNSGNIRTNTGADKVLAANQVYRFRNYNGVWYESA